jgi:hypothetical protein
METAIAQVASEGIVLMHPFRADADAVISQKPLVPRLHVANEGIVHVEECAIDIDAIFGVMPSTGIILHTNTKRTGFPVLAKDFRLGIR